MTIQSSALSKLSEVLKLVVRGGEVVSRLDGSKQKLFPVAISSEEGESLRDWVIKENAANTIEIGLAYGVSTLYICEGLLTNWREESSHVAIDPYQSGFKNCGLQFVEDAGVTDLVTHYAEESQIVLPRFLTEGRKFDFAFVDGSHVFEFAFLDFIYLGRLVKGGGIIFADDYQMPAIAKCVSFCIKNLGWKLEEEAQSDENHKWAVLRTPLEPVKRTYLDYVDF